MTTKEILSEKYARLRRQAEERIKRWPNWVANESTDLHNIIHELKIHLAELEIQNEEIKQALQKMAARQNKEVNIYEFGLLKNKKVPYSKGYYR